MERLEIKQDGQLLALATVDGQLRYARETLQTARGSQAENIFLYFEEHPIYYQSSGIWPDSERDHSVTAWTEFSITGGLLGLDKRLDGERIPISSGEPAAILKRGINLVRQTRPFFIGRNGCGYNKTLRWRNYLLTLNTGNGNGNACGPGQLQIFLQAPGGTRSQPLERIGTVNDSWLNDFDGDGAPELLIEFEDPQAAQSLLRRWNIQGTRLKARALREPNESGGEKHRGGRYYIHDHHLTRRFPAGETAEGLPLWQRLQYDWRANRWLAATAPARHELIQRFTGVWIDEQTKSVLDLAADGSLKIRATCGEFTGTTTAFPGDILLVTLAPQSLSACPENDSLQQNLAGFWFAEIINGQLHLASLERTGERKYTSAGFTNSPDTL